MAMEIFVLSDRRLNSMAEWQHAIKAEGFSLQLSTETPFPALNGFLPVQMGDRQTGFECDHLDPTEIMESFEGIEFPHKWKFVLAFRFGSKLGELESAWMAATAYARATQGVVLDEQDGKQREPNEARQVIRDIERERPAVEAAMHEILKKMGLTK